MRQSCSRYYVNSEYKLLKAVLLYIPGPEVGQVASPKDVLYLRGIDFEAVSKEYENILELYRKLKIRVYLIDDKLKKQKDDQSFLNMMYTRDLFFMTSEGTIMSNMAHKVRRGEVFYAETALKEIGVPIIFRISGDGTFEGADALWVNEKLVAVGIGNRTNVKGYEQVRQALENIHIRCVSVPVLSHTIHLLGAVQFVDSRVALVRTEVVDNDVINLLKDNNIDIVSVPENKEVRERYAMNIVVVAQKKIIMPANCLQTKRIYQNHGIEVVAETAIDQLINGGGGLGCATGVISRER